MPAVRTDIDRQGIAASIAIHGHRETERRTGIPIGTIHRIGKLAGVVPPPRGMRLQPIPRVGTPAPSGTSLEQKAVPAHQIVVNAMQDAGKRNALAVALRGTVVLEAALERAHDDPEKALQESPLIAAEVKSQQGANVPGFERQSDQGQVAVQVNIGMASAMPSPMMDDSCDPMFQ